ncbi:helix-turn-helix domain-containing protein [Pseudonocardia lacus]|uniref:helix-turn-helix domain-containing protein n=1 Tax=Pseudonocardia lacus TaxID=2835865 RepID=UPI001BDD0A1A|nr:helix-turn-helix transcriptional regulator [Pseudonocardia lacus]
MEPRNGSVVRRRQLARQLRVLRERAGLTLEAAAPQLDWSASKLSRIENAQQQIDVHGVRSMLDLYRVLADDWDEILDLCRESRQKGWWRAYGLGDDAYVGFENEATAVSDFTLSYVPGLLQTAEYARAVLKTVEMRRNRQHLSNFVAVRVIRQQRLTSTEHPLRLDTVIDEAALHRIVGSKRIHSAQLRRLIDAADLDTVNLQVLPASIGAHAAMTSPFTVLRFEGIGEPDMAYVEHTFGSLIIEKDAEVKRARLLFDRLRSDALSPADSIALIRQLAERT